MHFRTLFLALATTALVTPGELRAQDAASVTELRSEIDRMRAELARMQARLDQLQQKGTSAPAPAVAPAASAAPTTTAAAAAAPAPSWKGAPTFTDGKGLTFKPRGRLQLDTNSVSRPAGIGAPTLGWASDVRRAYLGADGTLGAGFGYRLEADFANGAQLTDAWLTYSRGPLTLTIGHQKPLGSLDELTSDLETSLLERASFTQAFGFERRLGVSATYTKGIALVSLGAFADDFDTMGSGIADNSYSLDGRVVLMPKVGDVQLHLAGSLHHRELNDLSTTLRYRARPGARTTEMRFVDTGLFSATAETGYGLEFAAIKGPVHATGEAFWQSVDRPSLPTPTFFGGYAEVGYVFAGGETRSYKNGAFGTLKLTRGMDKGGWGAWQVNLRSDWLDLNSAGVKGGRQRTLGVSLVWVPVDHVKVLANFLHINVDDTPVLAGARSSYSSDVVGLRTQYDF